MILRDGQDRGEKRFLESSGETILGKVSSAMILERFKRRA